MTARQRRRPVLADLLWAACALGWVVLLASDSSYMQRVGSVTAILAGLIAALQTSLAGQAKTRSVLIETLATSERVNEHLNDCAVMATFQRISARQKDMAAQANGYTPTHMRTEASVVRLPVRHRADEAS